MSKQVEFNVSVIYQLYVFHIFLFLGYFDFGKDFEVSTKYHNTLVFYLKSSSIIEILGNYFMLKGSIFISPRFQTKIHRVAVEPVVDVLAGDAPLRVPGGPQPRLQALRVQLPQHGVRYI